MKLVQGLYFPDDDTQCGPAVFREWKEKGEYVLSLVSEKRTAIQAGGNAGLFPLKLAEHFEHVITYEPEPRNWECLQANIKKAGTTNIEAVNGALGASRGTVRIARSDPQNCGATQVVEDSEGSIQQYCIDCQEVQSSVDLIWLDIEGFEYRALQGALNTIAAFGPVIVIENKGLIPEFPGGFGGSEAFVKWMATIGYRRESRIMRDDIYVPEARP